MHIAKIVVGIDFSEQSETALDQALNVARKTGAGVVMVHACTVPDAPSRMPEAMEGAAAHFERLLREQLEENRTKLEELRQHAGAGGVELSHMVIDSFADTGLAKAAKELGADLLVIGTHGRTGFQRFLLGSVAERAVRLTDGNVMVARPGSKNAGGYRRILVPVDFNELSDSVLDAALSVAAPGAHIDVFNAWQLPGASWVTQDVKSATGGQLREELAKEAGDAGGELLARHPAADGVTVAFTQAEGAAAQCIQNELEEGGYDLVVMGSHGRRGIRRFMLGSVAEATIRYAPCSVLVIHPPASEREKEDDK